MRDLDLLIVDSQKNSELLEQIIKQNEFFIIKCASAVTQKYVTKSDDEWSIAVMAFAESTNKYNLNKGSFLKFSELVIRRRLIDFLREQRRHSKEIVVDPIVFDTETTEDDTENAIHNEVSKNILQKNDDSIRLEISAVNEVFQNYGFTFFDLTSCSPQAQKTKSTCAKAVNFLLSHPVMIYELRKTKLLPIKIIQKNMNVPRKLLERHRKYIIAAVEILSGEYPLLAEYLRFIREEM
ncbi:hypothetical protein [Anaerosacchariphilus polymeriproducens]|uniref:RNA polymerase sigma factor SigI n=1 Tax=Anaerosacchariphilus polymeriproducens TaxID=1812858 RepID=A0A371ARI0_9FIRM|nr:hypothetical protein [Anaerosacchariphilus polymeriproducens]RDU22177.1 hypothetical protein DWV06_16745 [Anaerosacchariphilus polymeriproducens]